MNPELDEALRLGVRIVVLSSLEARRPDPVGDALAAFRSALAGDFEAAARAESLDGSGPETYRPGTVAKVLRISLGRAARDLGDLMAQETLCEAVRSIAEEEARNPANLPGAPPRA